jgi:hypothetical protein
MANISTSRCPYIHVRKRSSGMKTKVSKDNEENGLLHVLLLIHAAFVIVYTRCCASE